MINTTIYFCHTNGQKTNWHLQKHTHKSPTNRNKSHHLFHWGKWWTHHLPHLDGGGWLLFWSEWDLLWRFIRLISICVASEMNSVDLRTMLFLLSDVQPRAHLLLLLVSHAFSPQILSQARVKWLENLMQTTTTTSHMTYGNLAEMRNPTSVYC